MSMLVANYFTCLTISNMCIDSNHALLNSPGLVQTIGMGVINSIFYIAGLFLMQYNINHSGVVLSAIFSKLGLLVSLVMAFFAFKEVPPEFQVCGFLISIAAIVLINYDKEHITWTFQIPLILLLLAEGCSPAMSKIFGEVGNSELSDYFFFSHFLAPL